MSDEQRQSLPVFPLNTVLFPSGKLPLRIFEPRYVDMISHCGREGIGFVVVAIKAGHEAGEPATPYDLGTEVRIDDWDQDENGLLLIDCSGVAKVSLTDSWLEHSGLRFAHVRRFPDEPELPVSPIDMPLWGVLEQFGIEAESPSQRNASWLSARLVERLPLPLQIKQELLCMNDPTERLAEIQCQLIGLMQA